MELYAGETDTPSNNVVGLDGVSTLFVYVLLHVASGLLDWVADEVSSRTSSVVQKQAAARVQVAMSALELCWA